MRKITLLLVSLIALTATTGASAQDATDAVHYGWVSILPPVIAIGFALVFRQVLVALFIGLWFGAWAVSGMTIGSIVPSLIDSYGKYIAEAIADPDHVSVILFTVGIGGMVGVLTKNGGMLAVVDLVIKWANTRKKVQLGTVGMGTAIFFDDYANSLVVGNTMRSVTDKMKISREKLAYVVDSTAAPLATTALITTWVGFQVSEIGKGSEGIAGIEQPYLIFLNSLAYNFYPILAILMVLLVAWTGKDFGPMLKAEVDALKGAKPNSNTQGESSEESMRVVTPEGKPMRAMNAIVPIIVLIGTVIAGIYITGTADGATGIRDIMAAADSYAALVWGGLISSVVAIVMTVAQRIMTLEEAMTAWVRGVTGMLQAFMVLILAWALAGVVGDLGTANFLIQALDGTLPMEVIPFLTFIIAAMTAFGTGSSWGTIGILMPLVVPLTWTIAMGGVGMDANPDNLHILYSSVSCVLAGAVWGDHCSPISDTTVLSSLASDCNHIDHVKTQMPYALSVGVVAMLLGTLPVAYGMPWWLGYVIGVAAVVLILKKFGKRAEEIAAN